MPKKAKPTAKPKAQHLLVGKFFHSLEADRETIKWQGTVKAEVALGLLLVLPVLAQAGVDAVRKCKWETGPHETKEIVALNFPSRVVDSLESTPFRVCK